MRVIKGKAKRDAIETSTTPATTAAATLRKKGTVLPRGLKDSASLLSIERFSVHPWKNP